MVYEYYLTIKSVHDGDTFKADLDLGFYFTMQDVSVRIYGINAPELTEMVNGHRVTTVAGETSTLALMDLMGGRNCFQPTRTASHFGIPGDYLPNPAYQLPQLVVKTVLDAPYDKYGRVLGTVWFGANSLGYQMVQNGFASEYYG